MATTTKELKILITIANQAKDGLTQMLTDLAGLKSQVDALATGLGNIGDGATGLEGLGTAGQKAAQGLDQATAAAKRHEEQAHAHNEEISKLSEGFDKLLNGIKFVTGGFLALEAVHMAKEILDVAARTETLGVVLNVVGQNAGYTTAQLNDTDRAVQKLGITAESSRQSLTQLIQSGISLSLAAPLARASQDLAVISGVNSSETFKRLVTNIEQLDTLGLRFMGIMIDRESVFAQAAANTGKAITLNAQKQIFANAVLAEASKLTGTYEASMNSVGKLLTSFPRYVEEFKDSLGSLSQGMYLAFVKGAIEVIEAAKELSESFKETNAYSDLLGDSLNTTGENASVMAGAIKFVADALKDFLDMLKENHEMLLILKDVVIAFGVYLAATFAIGRFANFGKLMQGIFIAMRFAILDLVPILGRAALGFAEFWLAATGPVGLVLGALTIVGLGVAAFWDNLKGKGDTVVASQKQLVDQYIVITNQMVAKIKDEEAAVKALQLARDRLATASNPDERKAAEADVKAQQDKVAALQKQVADLNAQRDKIAAEIPKTGAPTEDTRKRLEEVNAAAAKVSEQLTREKQFLPALTTSLKAVDGDQGSFLHGISTALQTKLNEVDNLLDSTENKLGETRNSVSELLTVFEKMATGVTNTDEMDAFFTKLDKYGAKAKELGFDFSGAIENLKKEVTSQVATELAIREAGGQKAYAQRTQIARRMATLLRDQVNGEIALRKMQADIELDADKFRYEHGLILLDDYYAKRRLAIEQDKQDQLDANAALVHSLEVERDNTPDPREKARYEVQIAQARANASKIELKAIKDNQQTYLEAANDRIKSEQLIAQLRDDINNKTGNQEEALRAQAARDLQQQLEALSKTGTAEDAELIRLRNKMDLEEKLSKLRLDDLDKQLTLEKALLDISDLKGKSDVDPTLDTTLDKQAKLNENIRQRIEYTRQVRDATLAERDAALALDDVDRANSLNQKAVDLTKEMYTLRDSIKSVGEELQKTFTDTIASNLEAIIEHTKSFKQGMLDIFKDLNSQILKTLTKNVAEDFVKAINGKDKEGGNFFDQLMGFITGKPVDSKKDVVMGTTRENALWTKNADPTKDPVEPGHVTSAAEYLTELKAIAANTAKMAANAVEKFRAETKGEVPESEKPAVVKFDPSTALSVIGKKGSLDDKQAEQAQSSIFDQAAYRTDLSQFGLNGDFLRFMALKESTMNPDAVSKTGARGLMQVQPATYKALGYTDEDMKEPLNQVMAGARVLVEDLKRFDGNINDALAAYNAGPKVADARSAGDFSKQSAANKGQTDDYLAKLGTDNKQLFNKVPTPENPVPVVVVQGTRPTTSTSGKDLASAVDEAAQKKADADKEDADATDDDTQATKEGTDATKDNTDTVRESSTTFREGAQVLGDFTQAVVQATLRLNNLGQGGGGKPSPTGDSGSKDNSTDNTTDNYDVSSVDGVSHGETTSGTKVKDVADKTDTSGFFNTITGPISAAAGVAVGSKVGGNWGPFAGMLTTLLTPKLLKGMFDPLQKSLKDGFDQTGKGAAGDAQAMTGDVAGSLSSFFSSMSQSMSQFFSLFTGGSADNGGGGFFSMLGGLFGGGAVDGAASAGSVANVLFAEGGFVSGPGTGTSDSIPASLSNGEYVMTAEKTSQFLPVLEAMRSGSLDGLNDMFSAFNIEIPQKTTYAAGGYVQANNVNAKPGPTINRPMAQPAVHITVNTPDANSFLKSKDQIAAKTGAAISRAQRRNQ